MKKQNTAFSLIELSIVILIIGILIAGVTQSSRLITRMKIATARSQTQGSPINSIPNIVGWWETTLEQSFGGTEPEEAPAGGASGIATWYDINPQAVTKNNATQATAANNPGYTITSATTLNGLPTLQFNGSPQYLSFDGSSLAGTNYTVFVVEQRTASVGMGFMIAASTTPGVTNQLLQVGYRDNTNITWGQFNNDCNITVAGYNSPIPRIHSLVFNSSGASAATQKAYYLNGASQVFSTSCGTPSQGLVAYPNATFGYYGPIASYYKGNIGEIVIFSRSLKIEERKAIESYLGKKWNIDVS